MLWLGYSLIPSINILTHNLLTTSLQGTIPLYCFCTLLTCCTTKTLFLAMPRMALLLLLHIGTAAARWVIFVKTWQQNILPKIWGRDSSLCFSACILLTRDKGSIRDCHWNYIIEAPIACSVIIAWLKTKIYALYRYKLDLKCKSNFISERYGPKKEILEHYLLFVVILKVIP